MLLLLCAVSAVYLSSRRPPRLDLTRTQLAVLAAVALGWTLLVVASLLDFGTGHGLWVSVTAYDHGLRTAFIDATLRSGLPPIDPIYWPGHDVPMRYYYFWYATCASVARLAHVSSRHALIASCVWPPLGVVAILALYARHLLQRRGRELNHLVRAAALLMAVTGLDLLVVIALRFTREPLYGDMEWWSIDQVSSWLDTFLWVPHHAAALIAGLLCLLLLQLSTLAPDRHERRVLAVISGLSFASTFGLSSYMGIATLLLAAIWILRELLAPSDRRVRLKNAALAAVTAGMALAPHLSQLLQGGSRGGAPRHPLRLAVREMLDPGMLLGLPGFRGFDAAHHVRATELAAAILLVPGWAVELGFFAVVLAFAVWQRKRLTNGEQTLLFLTLAGLVVASVLRSGVIATNDYGIRAALLPQFFLLLLGALVLGRSTAGPRRFLFLLVGIGVAGSLYQVVLLRTFVPWKEAHNAPGFHDISQRTLALRTLYADMETRVPVDARVQFDPVSTSFQLYPHLLYVHRQIVTSELPCNISFGGDPASCAALSQTVNALYPTRQGATPDAETARQLCQQAGIQYLVLTRWDVPWAAQQGWGWTLPAVASTPQGRVLSCLPSGGQHAE